MRQIWLRKPATSAALLTGSVLGKKLQVTRKKKLSRETFMCSKHTSAALASLSEYLIKERGFDYFLTGKAQSDKIENRFGKSRQMSGGNLYASVRQFLESDRILKIKNLASLSKTMSEIKDIFSEEGLAFMVGVTKAARSMAVKDGLYGIVTPVHKGAAKFWVEKGLTLSDDQKTK